MQKHKQYKQILPQRLYHFIDVVASYQSPAWDELMEKFKVQRLDDKKFLRAAKQLHAEVYLGRNFVMERDVHKGVITVRADPYQDHADYFGVIDKESDTVVAIARQIHHNAEFPLPIFKHLDLKKDYTQVEPSEIVEISAFAKRRGVDSRALLLLFHEMFSHSRSKGHQYWLMAVDKKVYARMKTLFGPVLRRIGPETFYMGSDVIPAEVDMGEAERLLRRSYLISLPPLRGVRRFLYSSLAGGETRRISRTTFWNAYAKAYDGLLAFAPYKHLVEHVSDIVLSYKPERVLDLGCGTGNVTAMLVQKNPQVHVDAVDWSRAMLKMLPKKVAGKSVVISRSDALGFLERSDRRYDVIVMNNVLYTIHDRQRLWGLLRDHLSKDGRIVVANPDTADSRVLLRSHRAEHSFWSLVRPSLAAIWVFDSLISLSGPNARYDFTSKQDLLAEIEAAELRVEGEVGRCYGGHVQGIDLLFSVKNKTKAV